jgi:hypothetical protein
MKAARDDQIDNRPPRPQAKAISRTVLPPGGCPSGTGGIRATERGSREAGVIRRLPVQKGTGCRRGGRDDEGPDDERKE